MLFYTKNKSRFIINFSFGTKSVRASVGAMTDAFTHSFAARKPMAKAEGSNVATILQNMIYIFIFFGGLLAVCGSKTNISSAWLATWPSCKGRFHGPGPAKDGAGEEERLPCPTISFLTVF